MAALSITRGVQNLHRLQRIARVLTQHGFGHIVDRLDLGRFVPLWLRRKPVDTDENESRTRVGLRLTKVANDLGPVFVKLGQMLASRPDIVPPDILTDLRKLHDRVDPFDSDAARNIIAAELKMPVDEAFATFAESPLAAGSIGQVYRATLSDGRDVVVKVRRPNIEHDIDADLQLLKWLADALERWVPETRVYHPSTIAEEFERCLQREMDYMHEAATTARLRNAFADTADVDIPDVIWSHTTPAVLTLEAIDGENVEQAIASNGQRLNRKELAVRLADVYLMQFFDIGTFHADPHAGNILVTPPARIGLVDFGQIGIISDELAGHLLVLLLGAVMRDVEVIADALAEMGASDSKTNRRELMRDLQTLLDKYYGQPVGRMSLSTIFAEWAEVVRRYDLSIPRDAILMLKSLTTVWGVARQLDPDLDATELLKPRMASMVRKRLSPARGMRTAGITLWHVLSFLRSAPRQMREVLQQVSSGKWQVNVRHENLDILGRELDRSSNRVAFALVIAAIVVGSSVVVSSDTQYRVLGIQLQTFGVFGYLFAGILGIGLLWAILRSGRLS